MNIRLSKQAPAPIWSGDCGRKWKINLTCTDPSTVFWGTTIVNVPMAPQMFSAPGTFNVQCTVFFSSSSGSWYHLSLWAASPPWDGIGTSLSSVGSSHSPCSPWEWSGLWQDRSQCPLMVTGKSPPAQIVTALMVYVMALCTAWCWPVGLTGNAVCLQVFFHGKKSFLCDFCCWPLVGWHVLADGVVSLEGG